MIFLVGRYFRTLIWLKPIQVYYQIWYRLLSVLKIQSTQEAGLPLFHPPQALLLDPWILKGKCYYNHEYTFLNQTYQINIPEDLVKCSRLWQYNFLYMDYLLQPGMTVEEGFHLLQRFNLFQEYRGANEPYTISLRGINWIKFFSKHEEEIDKSKAPKESLDRYLFIQYNKLSHRLEYHLLGNHLLENGFSLLFGSFYFSQKDFYLKAKEILFLELKEQILTDGGHFELSPMYHQIILERLLDCINLLKNNKRFEDQESLLQFLQAKAELMLGWLHEITFRIGEIPVVNDAATGIAPDTITLMEYAKRLGIIPKNLPLGECGYRMFRWGDFELLADYGIPGPDYIPGHAHSDIFNFILYVRDKPFIVDTGVTTYEDCPRRLYERSTRAHNTVIINGREQSEMWGAFRVGRRAKPVITRESETLIEGYHTAYKPNTHYRKIEIQSGKLIIRDRITGPFHKAVAIIHFSPAVDPEITDNTVSCSEVLISFTGAKTIEKQLYEYSGGFNKGIPAVKLMIHFQKELIMGLGFRH